MHSAYTQINNKLKNEIADLKRQIKKQKTLLEFAGGGVSPNPEGSGTDPNFNVSDPNKGYIAGLATGAGANPSAIIANPTIILQTALERNAELSGVQLGAFNFSGVPTKPHFSANIGTGMGFGVSDSSFDKVRELVNRYVPNETNRYQNLDNRELGYLAWNLVNKANAVKYTDNLRTTLQQWGLDSEDLNTYLVPPPPQPTYGTDYYSTQDPGFAFARKIQQMQNKSENDQIDQSGKNVGRKVNNISNKFLKSRN